MSDLHINVLVPALAGEFRFARGGAGALDALVLDPRAEELRRFKVRLQFADNVSGGDALGFVDGEDAFVDLFAGHGCAKESEASG